MNNFRKYALNYLLAFVMVLGVFVVIPKEVKAVDLDGTYTYDPDTNIVSCSDESILVEDAEVYFIWTSDSGMTADIVAGTGVVDDNNSVSKKLTKFPEDADVYTLWASIDKTDVTDGVMVTDGIYSIELKATLYSPTGTSVSTSTKKIVIKFNGIMDTSVFDDDMVTISGSASLDYSEIEWADGDKTLEIPVSGLSAGKTYTVSAIDLESISGKTLDAWSGSFKTASSSKTTTVGSSSSSGGGSGGSLGTTSSSTKTDTTKTDTTKTEPTKTEPINTGTPDPAIARGTPNFRFTLNSSNVAKDGVQTPFDASYGSPYIDGGNTMVPVRMFCEAMDLTLGWYDLTRTITLTSADGSSCSIKIGDSNIYDADGNVIGQLYAADGSLTTPFIKDARTYLPLRAVTENMLGYNREDVIYHAETKSISIYKAEPAEEPAAEPAEEPEEDAAADDK